MRGVRKDMRAIEKRYPSARPPAKVVARHDRLAKRGRRLVKAYNAAIDEHNAVIASDCEPE